MLASGRMNSNAVLVNVRGKCDAVECGSVEDEAPDDFESAMWAVGSAMAMRVVTLAEGHETLPSPERPPCKRHEAQNRRVTVGALCWYVVKSIKVHSRLLHLVRRS